MILANFDFEDSLRRGFEATRAVVLERRLERLSRRLRVLAHSSERIVLSAHRARQEALRSPARRLLAWGESRAVAELRSLLVLVERVGKLENPISQLLDELQAPDPNAVRRVADRRFCHRLAASWGENLPGAEVAEDLPSARELVGRPLPGGASSWVAKSIFSAAGRIRAWIHPTEGVLRGAGLDSLLAQGPVVVEPWMPRVADFGLSASIATGEVRVLGIHQQVVDGRGTPQAIVFGRGLLSPEGLSEGNRDRLLEVAQRVGGSLEAEGYQGVFGVDAWTWRAADGNSGFQALGEINPRMTFGLVALAHAHEGRRRLDLDP